LCEEDDHEADSDILLEQSRSDDFYGVPATTFLNAVRLPFFGYVGLITYIAQPRNT
jgi:hypothetical protein